MSDIEVERKDGNVFIWFEPRWVVAVDPEADEDDYYDGLIRTERGHDICLPSATASELVVALLRGPTGPCGPVGAMGETGRSA